MATKRSCSDSVSWSDHDTAKAYDKFTEQYNFYWALAQNLLRGMDLSATQHVLDLACGTGVVIRALRDFCGYSGTITGIDSSSAMITIANDKCRRYNTNIRHIEAEKIANKFADLDAVVCSAALWQMEISEVFDGLSECLKPGGIFAFNFPGGVQFVETPLDAVIWELERRQLKIENISEFYYLPSQEESDDFSRIPLFAKGHGLSRYGAFWQNVFVRR